MSTYFFKVVSETAPEGELIPVADVSSLLAASGQTVSVVNEAGETPEGLSLVKRGKKLEVLVEDDVIASIDNFYSTEGEGGYATEGGDIITYSSDAEAADGEVVWTAEDHGNLAPMLAFVGGALMVANSAFKEKNLDATLKVTPLAGTFSGGAEVNVYSAEGELLSSGTLNEDGQVNLNVGTYRGLVVVEVVDANGDAVDYTSEATGEGVDLDGTLRAMGEVDDKGNVVLSVTPLTELAARQAGLPDDLSELADSPLTAEQVEVNDQIAALFGLEDILAVAITTLEDEYSEEGGDAAAKLYGDILAILSGAESDAGGLSAMLDALASEIVITDGVATLTSTGGEILAAGLAAYNEGEGDALTGGSFIEGIPTVADLPDVVTLSTIENGLNISLGNLVEGDVVVVALGTETYDVTVSADMLEDGTATISFPADQVTELDDGVQTLTVSVNGVERQSTEVTLDVTVPTATISFADSQLSIGESTTVTVVFSEEVEGFALSDLMVTSGSVSNLSSEDGITYTLTYTADTGVENLSAYVALSTGSVADLNGNVNTSAYGQNVAVDTLAPTFNSSASTTIAIDENTGGVVFTAATDDDEAVFTLSGTDADYFTVSADGEVSLIEDADYESGKTSYSVDVVATDSFGNATTETLTINVTNLDDTAPVITSSSAAQNVDENSMGGEIVYVAQGYDNILDVSSGFTLSLVGDDADYFSFNSITGAVTLLEDPDHEVKDSYSFVILAEDNFGNTSDQEVTLLVNDLDEVEPVITSAESASVDENSPVETVVYTATADDSGDISDGYTFYIEGTDFDDGYLAIDAESGEVTLTAEADHESGKTSYSFILYSVDAAGNTSDGQEVTINVNDLDEEAPEIVSDGVIADLDENTPADTVLYTAEVDDTLDISEGIVFSLTGDDAELFSINDAGELTLNEAADFESGKTSYSVTIVATDLADHSDEQTVSFNVTNVDDTAAVITSGTVAAVIDENTSGIQVYTATATDDVENSGDVTFSLAEEDLANFAINAETGAVGFIGSADAETADSISFTVIATDGSGNTSEEVVTMGVNDVFDMTSSETATAIDENTGEGQVVYTATAGAAVAASYVLGGDDAAYFSIDETTGEVTLLANANYEDKTSYSFVVSAIDEEDNASNVLTVTLAVNNLDEVAPVITSATTVDVAENNEAGAVVYTATSYDGDDVSNGVTYSLAEADAAYFSINAATGAVSLLESVDFEELVEELSFTVTATDAAGNASSEQVVTVNVINQDEVAPTITSGDTGTAFDENNDGPVVVYTALADDSGDVSNGIVYSLAEEDLTNFSIDADTGVVSFIGSADYESGTTSYSFTVTATDAADNVSTAQEVTVDVNDIEVETVTVNVLIDFVNGTSTLDVDGDREFNENTSYNIYLLVDSDSNALAEIADLWSGAANLGSDDTLILVGDDGAVMSTMGEVNEYSVLNTYDYNGGYPFEPITNVSWKAQNDSTGTRTAASVSGLDGTVSRWYTGYYGSEGTSTFLEEGESLYGVNASTSLEDAYVYSTADVEFNYG